MKRNTSPSALYAALVLGLCTALAACSGGSSSMNQPTSQGMASMPLVISDSSSDDWANVGVRLLSVALVPAGGGSPVTIWTAPAQAPYVNLEQLDQIGEVLGNVSVPAGTYSGAVLTISANSGDVLLTSGADPDSGFPVAGGTDVAGTDIQVQNAQGSSGAQTVAVTVNFASPLTVGMGQTTALNLEFQLGHPAFLVNHTPASGQGRSLWSVDFRDCIRHRPVFDISRLLLRHTYGTVSGINSDGALTITKVYPAYPLPADGTAETAVASTQTLTIAADGVNGTIVYNSDNNNSSMTVKSFANSAMPPASIIPDGDYVRIAARYQVDGSLVAVRVWYSSTFNTVWLSPEGHVLSVDTANDVILVTNEHGRGQPVTVNSSTQFFFQGGSTAIETGTGILSQIYRGFKVHVTPVDASANPLVAASVDIETAAFSGAISKASSTGNGSLTYTSLFGGWHSNFVQPQWFVNPGYSVPLSFIAPGTPNGINGNGFIWWNFSLPTVTDSSVTDFVNATNGGVNFGGTVGTLTAYGASTAMWGDGTTTNTTGWYLPDAVLIPSPLPFGVVAGAFTQGTPDSFTMNAVFGGTNAVTVDLSSTVGSATLIYKLTRDNDDLSFTPVDITTTAGVTTLTTDLVAGTPVKVYGVPQPSGNSIRAYVLVYFTGMLPMED